MWTGNTSFLHLFNFNTDKQVDFNVSKVDGNVQIQEL